MHENARSHEKAAELHELVAQEHRTAAEHNEKGDEETGSWHSRRALEYSNQAYKLAMSTRYNSGSLYENHQRAAELHDAAAHAHRVGEQHGKQDHPTGWEVSRQALEHSQQAHGRTQAVLAGHAVAGFGHDAIAALAHELWESRGCPEGSPEKD